LDGGAGNDTLNGGLNNDTYIFGRGYAVDTIVENDPSVNDQDIVQLGSDIATDQLWFRHVGNNLEATIVGTNDKLVVSNWYLGDAYRVEQFVTSDGMILLDTQVEALVSAMAAFSPPAGVGSIISQEVRDQLQPVLAASWHSN
jgi:Ca2+-binding RTX toxin-like protein